LDPQGIVLVHPDREDLVAVLPAENRAGETVRLHGVDAVELQFDEVGFHISTPAVRGLRFSPVRHAGKPRGNTSAAPVPPRAGGPHRAYRGRPGRRPG